MGLPVGSPGLDQFNATVTEINTKLDNFIRSNDALNTKIEKIDTTIEELKTKIEKMDTKIETMDTKIETMDTKIEKLTVAVKNNSARIQNSIADKYNDEIVPLTNDKGETMHKFPSKHSTLMTLGETAVNKAIDFYGVDVGSGFVGMKP